MGKRLASARCVEIFSFGFQSAQSCTNVSILEWSTARMLLLFESLDCMGMCYLVFNIWHLLGCCRTFFCFPLMISDLTELITSAWIFLFVCFTTIHTSQFMGNDSVRLIYSFVHEVIFPQVRNCRIMWFSLRMGLFLMDDIHFSDWIVSVLSRPVEFI